MKKNILILIFCTFFANLFSQSDIKQSVSPKNFYVGDSVELIYSFTSGIDFFSDLQKDVMQRELNISSLPKTFKTEDFTISRIFLRRNQSEYFLIVHFVPWTTGMIIFPEIDLCQMIFKKSLVPVSIKLEPVEVGSLLDGKTELKQIQGPKLLPGTSYFLMFLFVFSVLILAIFIKLITKWKKIRLKFQQIRLKFIYKKNQKKSNKLLIKLLKNERISDSEFALENQRIMKNYISVRFGENFSSVETSKLFNKFEQIFQGTMSDFFQEQIENLISIFYRTDYIRFAQNSIDSKRIPKEKFSTVLNKSERILICEKCKEIIKNIEIGEK